MIHFWLTLIILDCFETVHHMLLVFQWQFVLVQLSYRFPCLGCDTVIRGPSLIIRVRGSLESGKVSPAILRPRPLITFWFYDPAHWSPSDSTTPPLFTPSFFSAAPPPPTNNCHTSNLYIKHRKLYVHRVSSNVFLRELLHPNWLVIEVWW